jgi:hypothetical protein
VVVLREHCHGRITPVSFIFKIDLFVLEEFHVHVLAVVDRRTSGGTSQG